MGLLEAVSTEISLAYVWHLTQWQEHETRHSNSSATENSGLLGCNAVLLGAQFLMFRKIILHSSSESSSLDHSSYKTLQATCPMAQYYIPENVNFYMHYKPWKMRILFWHLPQNPYLSSCPLHPCTSTYNTDTMDLQLGFLKSVSPAVFCPAANMFSISSDDT